MTSARRGSLIGATWLIGLGIVFLIQRAADLGWGQAWPMFVILAGVASLVGVVVNRRYDLSGVWAFTWPIAWIVVGVLLLMSTTGSLAQGPGELISDYWPWALVALGVWFVIGAVVPAGRRPDETLAVPLGGASEAGIRIQFGAGTLATRPAAAGNLVDGTFTGGVLHRLVGPGRIELQQDTRYGLPWLDRASTWTVGLTAEVPLDLRIDAGAHKAVLDLRDLRVRGLELHTGASDTRVLLPRAAGLTTVKAESGAASLTFEVPDGVAARIRTRMAISSMTIDQTRFPPSAGGYESAGFASAANRVEIDAQGGVGSLRVVGAT